MSAFEPRVRRLLGRASSLRKPVEAKGGRRTESEQADDPSKVVESLDHMVDPSKVVGSLDDVVALEAGEPGRIELQGWAIVDGAAAAAVLVRVGGQIAGALSTGVARPDVADWTGNAGALHSGFSGVINLRTELISADDRALDLEVEALDQAGATRGLVARRRHPLQTPSRPAPDFAGSIDAEFLASPIISPRFAVSGWAAADGLPATTVTFWVGTSPVGVATTGLERVDSVEATGRPEVLTSGFNCSLDLLPALVGGQDQVPLSLSASVAGAGGTVRGWLDSVELEYAGPRAPLSPIGQIDHWKNGDLVARDLVRIYGWVVIPGGRAAGVAISVNGRSAGMAPIGIRRPELQALFGGSERIDAGFDTKIDLGDVEGDEALIEAAVVSADPAHDLVDPASCCLAPLVLRLAKRGAHPGARGARSAARGALDVPLDDGVHRGVVNLWGWALGRHSPLDRVEVLVEGESRGFARFGLDRLDIADRFDAPFAAASGFEHLVDFSTFGDDVRRVRITVIAHPLADDPLEIAGRTVRLLDRAKPPSARSEARAAVLQARTDALIAASPAPAHDDLRLLAVTHHLGYGGAQLWLQELLLRAGAGKKFACGVLAPQDGPLRTELERMGVEVHVTNGFPVNSTEIYEAGIGELALWSRARGWNAALVNTALSSMGADLAVRLGLPSAWAIHESFPPEELWAVAYPPGYMDPIVRRRADALFGEVDALIFEAEATRQLFLSHCEADRARLVPYGIDVKAIDRYRHRISRDQARHSLGFDEEDFVILVVGTLEPRKAQTIIAQAFATVAAAHPDARLLLVGGAETPYTEAVERFIEGTNLGERITIQPVVKDTYLRYRAADLFLTASDIESMPRSVLEVMYFGVPVLATSVFGLPELIQHGETGLLFEAKSLAAAIEALDASLSLPRNSLLGIGARGREHVGTSYDSNAYSAEIVGLLHELALAR